ncbi:MAG TPA: hypothetical protein VN687_01790 [Blastocatellia bacterium]|nr:hypothetical protein [Blastocatellia bacterium]
MRNLDDAKFCRACGMDLDTVSVALAEAGSPNKPKKKSKQRKPAKTWAEKRSAAMRDIFQGAILTAASAVICVAFAMFLSVPDWLILWTVFFGWMACWGVISLAFGIGGLIESSTMSRAVDQPLGRVTTPTGDELASSSFFLDSPPASITELTTEPLVKHTPLSNKKK